MPQLRLEDLREQVDMIDKKIVSLLEQRAELSLSIGERKKADSGKSVFSPAREHEVYKSVLSCLPEGGILKPRHIQRIYTEIISACRDLQDTVLVYTAGRMPALLKYAANSRMGSFVKVIHDSDPNVFIEHLMTSENSAGIVVSDEIIDTCAKGPIRQALNDKKITIVDRFQCFEGESQLEFCALSVKS